MTTLRQNTLKSLLERYDSKDETLSVTLIRGIFGAGKSEFLTELLSELKESSRSDAICYFNFNINRNFIVEYLTSFEFIVPGTEVDSLTYNFDECNYNKTHLYNLLDEIEKKDSSIISKILDNLKLRFFENTSAESDNTDSLTEKLNLILDKKGDRRFVLQNHSVAAESFIVDLMNLFYPINEKYPNQLSYLKTIQNPIKINLVFDNIDKFTFTLVKWLNDILMPLCLEGKFSDFTAYVIDDDQKDISISEFLDFSFVICTRKEINDKDGLLYLENIESRVSTINLKQFDFDETGEYLSGKSIDLSNLDLIYSYSFGIPFLIDMFIDFNADEINEVVRDSIYDKFTEKVLDCRNELEREAVMMSAFLDSFDADALRCNRFIGDENYNLFDYLKYNSDLFLSVGEKLSLREPFRTIFIRTFERDYKSRVIEYKNISDIYGKVQNQYPKLQSEEINILRSLAYFKCFDFESSVDLAFDDKSSAAKKFIKNNQDLFIKNHFTYSLIDSHRLFLDDYNKIIDRKKYEMKKQLITGIWREKEKELISEKEVLEGETAALKEELAVYGDDPSIVKKEYDNHQKQFIENENELIRLRKKMEQFSASRFISSMIVNMTASVMAFIIGYFFPELFSTPNNHSSIIIIQYILYFISIVFLMMGLNFTIKILKTKRNNKGLQSIKDQIKKIEDDKADHRDEMMKLRSITSNWQKGVNELTEKIKSREKRVAEIGKQLLESYIG